MAVAMAIVGAVDESTETIMTATHNSSSHLMANPRVGDRICHKRRGMLHLKETLPLTLTPSMVATRTTLRCGIRPLRSNSSKLVVRGVSRLPELHKRCKRVRCEVGAPVAETSSIDACLHDRCSGSILVWLDYSSFSTGPHSILECGDN